MTSNQLQPIVQQELAGIAGAQVVAFQPPPLPGSNGLPIQFVINTTGGFDVAERGGAEVPAGGAGHRPLHLPEHRPQDRRAAGHRGDRSRQGRPARPEDERHRRRAGLDAGRRLRQLLRARRPLLQGDPAGPADARGRTSTRSSTITSSAADGSSVPLSTVAKIVTKAIPQSLNHFQQLNSATIQGVAFPGVSQAEALETLQELGGAHAAAGLLGRLRRRVAPVHAGDRRLHRHLRLRADHHLPVAGGPVRELPRSADHPVLGPDVDRGRADLPDGAQHHRPCRARP